jgi:hypothetical protein
MSSPPAQRTSEYHIRASVLDAALELGLANGGVAEWLQNPTVEVEEDSEVSMCFPYARPQPL